jgi:cytochrome c553
LTDPLVAVASLILLGAAPPVPQAPAVPARPKAAETCTTCHGADGRSADPRIPSLAGQQAIYLSLQLVQYREQRRKDLQMSPIAEKLSDAEIRELAAYYAALAPFASRRTVDPARAAAGKKVSDAQHCGSCHLPDLSGQKHVPRLVGQQHDYVLKEMRAFKDQTRADLDGSMTMAAQPLSPRDIEDLAEYISSLAPSAH